MLEFAKKMPSIHFRGLMISARDFINPKLFKSVQICDQNIDFWYKKGNYIVKAIFLLKSQILCTILKKIEQFGISNICGMYQWTSKMN